MRNAPDVSGQRFGRWTVLHRVENDRHGRSMWLCECDCGTIKSVGYGTLRSGKSQSCGCLQKQVASRLSKTHGMCKTAPYHSWCKMIQRCTNPNDPKYSGYGGRGIKVCSTWTQFDAFWEDMGPTFHDGLQLDRIDNDGDYCPENCRWADRKTQQNNTRRNHFITIGGATKTVFQWAREVGISPNSIFGRLRRGWKGAEAVMGRSEEQQVA